MRDKKHVFKRGLSLFLALTMCLSLLQVTAFAAKSEHDGNQGNSTNCELCKKDDHTPHDNSPNKEQTCKCCGVAIEKGADDKWHAKNSQCEHNWDTGTVTTPATCTTPGVKTFTCSKCQGTKTEEVEALEHEIYYTPNYDGTHDEKCSNCDHHLTGFYCSYEDGTCTICGAKCLHLGKYTYEDNKDNATHAVKCLDCSTTPWPSERHSWVDGECEFCKAKKLDDYVPSHVCNFNSGVYKSVRGGHNEKCSIDGCDKYGPKENHQNEWVKLEPYSTCTEQGKMEQKCSICQAVSGRGWDNLLPHTYKQNGYHSWEPIEGEDQHGKYCTVCKQYIGAAEHKWKPHFQKPSIPAACEKDGAKFFLCEICGATDEETIPALGHKYGEYTEKGTGHAKQCSVCGDYTPMEPHEYVDGVCVKCGAKKPVQPVEPCEHKWMWKDNKDGTHTFHCELCGVDDADFVNELHKFIGGECDKCGAKEPEQGHTHEFTVHVATASVPATCETVGKDVYKCKVAGCTERWTFDLAPLGHDFSGEPVITESTEGCMKGGVKTWTCQRQGCDATKEEPVDAQVSHTYGDKIAEKPAACEVPGMKEHYECEVCGKLFVGTHEVSAEDLEIPALEHSFTHYVPDNNGSCTTAGTETAVCDNGCGETDTRTVAGTGEGHTEVVDAAVAPTCTEAGLTEGSHCSACGEVLAEQEVVAAAGHQYDDGVTVTVPDCNHAGATRFTCEVCGDSYEEADSPFGHEVVSYASVAATCTANGYTGGSYCSRCGSVITARTVVPAVGHSWNAGVVTTQPTYYNTGVRTYTCARDASHTYTETIPALTYPGGGGGYNPVTPVTPVTPNVPVTPNNPVNIPDANVPQGSTPDGLTTIEDENTPLGGITFVDVTPTDWFYDAVQYVFEKGLMLGVSDTEFGPNLSTTRGMIVTILYRMEGEPEAAAAPFTDVEPGLWYSNAIGWGAANDIVNGYGDGRFGPNDQITREQMAAIFYRYAQYKGYDVTARADLSGYADADQISEYAVEAMQWAVGVKLVNGLTADTLVPKGQATRAQVATMLMRFDQEIAAA